MNNRQRLEAQIEKQLHSFMTECFEHAVDSTVLSIQKKHKHLDRGQAEQVLQLARVGVSDGFLQNIDRFMSKLDTTLVEFTGGEENPLPPSTK